MIEKYVLDNGIEVICDHVDFFQTFSLGFWIRIGSIYENKFNNGYTHLLEHMLFKGTKKRSYLDISKEIDGVGGYINAFTEREYTCFYVSLASHHLDLGTEILWDMLTNSTIDKEELDKEKMVIVEEIKMYEDVPEELVIDLLFASMWKNNSLGFPILGNIQNIQHVNRNELLDFYAKYYSSNNIVVSITGNFDKKRVLKQLESFSFKKAAKNGYKSDPIQVDLKKSYMIKDLEQIHFQFGFQAINRVDDNRYALHLLHLILGGGSSSRLFLEIREKLGLCYSIYSFFKLFEKDGVLGIGSSTSLENYNLVIEAVYKEIEKLIDNGITEEELYLAKEQFKGNVIFGQENLEARMNRNAKCELNYGRNISYDETFAKINNVTLADVNKLIADILKVDSYSFYSLGPAEHTKMHPFSNPSHSFNRSKSSHNQNISAGIQTLSQD